MQGFQRMQQFQPAVGASGVLLTVPGTNTSANVLLPAGGTGDVDLELTNSGTKTAWVTFGDTNTAAAVIPTATPQNGYILLAGQTKVISIGTSQAQYLAGICASTDTTTIYATRGQGA